MTMPETELTWQLVRKLIAFGQLDEDSAFATAATMLPVIDDYTRQQHKVMADAAAAATAAAAELDDAELTDDELEDLAGVAEVADEIRTLTKAFAEEMLDVVRDYSGERLRNISDTAEALLEVQEAQHELSFADGVHAVLRLVRGDADLLAPDARDIL